MGGGKSSQLDSLTLGISRALTDLKADNRFPLRTAGLLTRDSRARQRRMVGMGGKSRRRKQSPKR
jgi:small subunit ribosomal protein S9